MIITALNQGIKDKERVNVFIDGSFKMALDKSTLTQENLFVGKEVQSELFERLKDLDTYNLIARKVLNWSLSRPRSSKEIADKVQKIISNRNSNSLNQNIDIKTLTEFVINKLNEFGINDRAFGIWWVENRHSQAKYGRNRILAELTKKGINSSLAKELLNTYFEDDSEIAKNLLNKKFGVNSVKEIKDYKIKAKAYRFLVSKGFKAI